ncbi:protein-export chaperone SecB [Streptococcus salivarius]|uniref:protein-export chaperone SecB n=1 Tax=Streptococcus salivarius TaxID=1304 RepID=UPI0005A1A642|nr:protein-export chaperone SecB [Streptococcus salivarius]
MNTKENKSQFQFSRPVLKEAIFLANADEKDEDVVFSFETRVQEPQRNEDNQFSSKVTFTVSNFEDLSSTSDEPYFLRVSMESTFSWVEILDFSVDDFLKINAPSLLLSFIRPIIANLTGVSEYKDQFLPFIDFSNNKKQ